MEYMDVGNLQDIMRQIGPIPEIILGAMAYQILKGLEYLHKVKRVVHRDIKPLNILMNKKGYVSQLSCVILTVEL